MSVWLHVGSVTSLLSAGYICVAIAMLFVVELVLLDDSVSLQRQESQ